MILAYLFSILYRYYTYTYIYISWLVYSVNVYMCIYMSNDDMMISNGMRGCMHERAFVCSNTFLIWPPIYLYERGTWVRAVDYRVESRHACMCARVRECLRMTFRFWWALLYSERFWTFDYHDGILYLNVFSIFVRKSNLRNRFEVHNRFSLLRDFPIVDWCGNLAKE